MQHVLKRLFSRCTSESSGITYLSAVFSWGWERVAGRVKEIDSTSGLSCDRMGKKHTHTHTPRILRQALPLRCLQWSSCHWRMTTRATLFWSTSSRRYCFSTIGAASPWDRKCNRYSTMEFLPSVCSASTNLWKRHNCSCGTRTVEKLKQYRAGIGTVTSEDLSWRLVGNTTLFLRHQRPVSITEKCGTVKLFQTNNFTNVGSITYLLPVRSRVLLENLTSS
jgi:hypothetical protein